MNLNILPLTMEYEINDVIFFVKCSHLSILTLMILSLSAHQILVLPQAQALCFKE